jgi:CIC family chloride channel protein
MEDKMESKAKLGQFKLSILAIFVGIVAGFGAVVFRALIAFIHNFMFLGKFSFTYDANLHIPASPWGPWIILVPVAGAVLVAYLVKNFAPEAKGHGVPEVMDAIYYNKGIIRPVVAVVKSIASAISIGTGGSVGREGPIVQIGSSFGSTLGQYVKMAPWQRATLIGAGAGAGIAATFNTPIGGLLFAIELIVPEISVRTFVPVAIATSTATFIGRIFFGNVPSFIIPGFDVSVAHITNPYLLTSYIGLGLLAGLISAVFIKSIYGAEDLFDSMKGNYYTKHMFGMLLQGILIYLLFVYTGHYYVAGVGYSTIQDILMGSLLNPYFLLLLMALKLLATSLTLGSGASGGIFSPSLFIGAALGGMYGSFMKIAFPGLPFSPAEFAVVGMAGGIAGITGGAITSIVMIFEMTRNYNVIVPVIITVAIADGVRRALSPDSIYTKKLSRRGHLIPEIFHMNTLLTKRVKDVMEKRVIGIQSTMTVEEVLNSFTFLLIIFSF